MTGTPAGGTKDDYSFGQVAIADVWSALRFRPLTAGEPPFRGR